MWITGSVPGHHHAASWALVPGGLLALLTAACIGPNPDFMERLPESMGATSSSGAVLTGAPATSTGSATDTTGSPSSTGSASGASTDMLGTTSASTTDNSGTGDTSSGDPPCELYQLQLDAGPLDLMFVVDKSAAMMSLWDHDSDDATPPVSRWTSVNHAVAQTAGRFDASIRAGLALYPSKAATDVYGAAQCPVADPLDVGLALTPAAAIADALPPAAATVKGARPAATAAIAAIAALSADHPEARKQVLFLTGGAGNCSAGAPSDQALLEAYDESLHPAINQAFFAGILTHVIGVGITSVVSPNIVDSEPDGVDTYDKLNNLAQLGGTAKAGPEKFWAVDDEAELLAALDASVRHGLSCVLTLKEPAPYPFAVELVLAGQMLPFITDCAGENGWHYEVAGVYDRIELCGQACGQFQEVGAVTFKSSCQAG